MEYQAVLLPSPTTKPSHGWSAAVSSVNQAARRRACLDGGVAELCDDIRQCNDAYSASQIAVALSNAFGCGVNDLPLSMVLSWYEQKAVAILLTLLHLGIRNIRLGPTSPAFLTPAVRQVLADTFNLRPITEVEDDLKAILYPAA